MADLWTGKVGERAKVGAANDRQRLAAKVQRPRLSKVAEIGVQMAAKARGMSYLALWGSVGELA